MASCLDGICYYHTQKKTRWWLITAAIVVTVLTTVVLVVLRFAVTPHIVTNVEDARLNAFAFSTTQGSAIIGTREPFFSYDLAVALAVRNPNRAMSIEHTKPLVATIVFHDRRLRNLTIVDGGYRHGPGKDEPLCFNAAGEIPAFRLGDAAADDYRKQNATGLFKVEMRLSGEITYKGIAIAKKSKLSLSCPLALQLAPPGPEIVEFHEVTCEHVNEDQIHF
ncbi:hypothetical protein ACP4OV_002213 [Aristida adscensionis]